MHKLIRKYLYAGSIYAADKNTNYPSSSNTGNVGAVETSNLTTNGNYFSNQSNFDVGGGLSSNVLSLLKALQYAYRLGQISNDDSDEDTSDADSLKLEKRRKFFNNLGQIGMGALSAAPSVIKSFTPDMINSNEYNTVDNILGVASEVPVIGKYARIIRGVGSIANALGSTRLKKLNTSADAMDTQARAGGGYDDFLANWNEASNLSGERVGAFTDSGALNRKIINAQNLMYAVSRILNLLKNNDLITANLLDRLNEWTMMNMNGGFGNISFGRKGLKLDPENLERVHRITSSIVRDSIKEIEFTPEIEAFKEGGKMNVIPEGSLHARLHHMENAEGLTKKGIPVVSIAEGGEIELQAEIELNEIIFNLEVTRELEKLMEDGSENAAIEAGKLLVKEIFENTDDRTGLISNLDPNKEIDSQEKLVKEHRVI